MDLKVEVSGLNWRDPLCGFLDLIDFGFRLLFGFDGVLVSLCFWLVGWLWVGFVVFAMWCFPECRFDLH